MYKWSMTTKYGALLKFKDGVSQAEAIAALKTIKHLLDLPEGGQWVDNREAGTTRWVPGPLKGTDIVKAYNPDHGGPVWYIP